MNEVEQRPFEITGVVYLLQPAGAAVRNLDELLDRVRSADPETVFLHTQMPRLRWHASEDTPVDDFSAWVRGVVHDAGTAERLAFAIQSANAEVEDVRAAIVRVLESTPARARPPHSAPPAGALTLLRFEAVEVPTGFHAETVEDLMDQLSVSDRITWFHHLIEEAWLRPGPIPIVDWVRAAGHARFADLLLREATSGRSVDEIRSRALHRWRRSGIVSRLADGTDGASRASVVREAAGRLARRLTRTERP